MMNPLSSVPTLNMPDRRFLAHFEPRQRGHIANLFLVPVRDGVTEPHRVVSVVRHDLLAQAVRWKRWGNLTGTQRNERIISEIDAHFDEAVDLARYYLWWEGNSAEEQRRIKAERWMAQPRQASIVRLFIGG